VFDVEQFSDPGFHILGIPCVGLVDRLMLQRQI